jgi:hypothetical protein
MEIIVRKVKELIPYEKNPRKNDDAVKYVKASIEQFGFKVPVIIDKDDVIVAGHTRVKAAKELGMKEVPCIVAEDLTEEQIKAFRLADNKTSEMAGWDFPMLEDELAGIEFDMAEFGFYNGISPDDLSDSFSLKEGEKEPFQTMSFTFSDEQAEDVKQAISEMKKSGAYADYEGDNQNSNGNALWLVVVEWKQRKT